MMLSRILMKLKLMQQIQNKHTGITACTTSSFRLTSSLPPVHTKEKLDELLAVPETSSIVAEKKTRSLVNYYNTLIPNDKNEFLCTLAHDYGCNQSCVLATANQLTTIQDRGPAAVLRSEERMREILTPKYQRLFTQISRLENGVKFLVDLRADILQILSTYNKDNSHLQAMSVSLRNLLSLWFSVGFLQVERITWKSPCDMLQKISDYEAVHPIRNWADLKRRVGPYRRCFVFTHNSMPREPIVVLHTALTNEISDSIQKIVSHKGHSTITSQGGGEEVDYTTNSNDDAEGGNQNEEQPVNVSTAIFYSITSTQRGLQGVELGNYLIKHAVRELQTEFPAMYQFSSLSPIPGFRDWFIGEINKYLHKKDIGEEASLFSQEEYSELSDALSGLPDYSSSKPMVTLKKSLLNNSWIKHKQLCMCLERILMKMCAWYLYVEKRRSYALNPVANFHLRNGAVMWRLNWLGDTTPRGLNASCGIMVNYRYFLENTEENSRQYTEEFVIPVSQSVLELVKQSKSIPQPSHI